MIEDCKEQEQKLPDVEEGTRVDSGEKHQTPYGIEKVRLVDQEGSTKNKQKSGFVYVLRLVLEREMMSSREILEKHQEKGIKRIQKLPLMWQEGRVLPNVKQNRMRKS